jgi:hypothetical protein
MKRRELIALMGASVAWPFAALAQEPGRTYRIGCLTSSARNSPPTVAMFGELRRLGFIEGQNLTIDWRVYALHIDLIPEFAAELVKAKVDVIYASGDAVRVAQRATATIPVLGIAQDMVGLGLVTSLARPGGNTTGVSVLATELDGKRQEILIEAVPGLRRMAILADSKVTRSSELQALQEAARARGVEVSMHRVASTEEITATIDTVKGVGRCSAKRFVVAAPLRQSPAYYGPRRGAAPSGRLSISGRGRGRGLRRLRPQYRPNLSRHNGPEAGQALARHQARRHPGRTTDALRALDQSQNRQCAWRDGSRDIAGTRRQGDRVRA